jgi:hypothetical protein
MKIRFIVKDSENQPVEGAKVNIKYGLTDTILLTMHPQGRFNNVVGPLTVQYDQTVGSLRGRGGPVESFEISFTPEDLVQKPNPHVEETIAVKPEIELQFLKVKYHDRFEQDTRIMATPGDISVEFINVGEINP